MDQFTNLKRQATRYLALVLFANGIIIVTVWWLGVEVLHLNPVVLVLITMLIAGIEALLFATVATRYVLEPLHMLWQAIVHVSPEHSNTPAPNLQTAKLGRELINNLALQIYQLASNSGKSPQAAAVDGFAKAIASNLPLPLLVLDKEQNIAYANNTAAQYLGYPVNDLVGKNFYAILDLAFPSNDTLDVWLQEVRAKTLTASRTWDRVRLKLPDHQDVLQFDMAAYYNKDNPAHAEIILVLFDHTKRYSEADAESNLLELAVHELRTPVTLLRGYIDVFEDELQGKLDPQMTDYMNKMRVSAEQLSSFISNILNVARIDANQLMFQLHEYKWEDVIKTTVNDFDLRARVHHKTIEYNISPDLPSVAVDRVSIYEVLANLLDNAIKYSPDGQKIMVTAKRAHDGMIETTVQDNGVGIPSTVLPHLFEKYGRNYHNQRQVSGTGLGLYLSKAIITAHGGNIWVRSKENEGTTIGFTLQPYSALAQELKTSDNKEIVRGAYGWIKNHSLYRK